MSQVTDPVMLDSTGQTIVSKLQDVIDAINGGTIDPLAVTANGTYTPSGTTLGYGPVTVNVGGSDAPVSNVAVVNNTVVSDGVTITAQPAIVDGEMSATSSLGLAVNIVPDIVVVIEMDYTYDSSSPAILLLSFGGSNTNTGVLNLGTGTFQFYGNGLDVPASISMSAGTPHHLKIEFSATSIVLYIDGTLAATLTNARFASVLSYLLDRSKVTALLWNQSWHGEYNTSKVNNLSIKLVTDQ